MNYNTVKKREPNFFHQWCETLIKSYDYCFNQFQSKGNLCKIFKLRKRSKLKKTKTKQLLSFLFLLHINYRCGSLGNFKTAITLHDLCLLWEICVCTVYIFLLSFKLSMFLSLSFITQYHYRLTKKKYCFTFTCPKFYFQLFLHKTQRYTKACVSSHK